jgi:hypothetical protein
MITIKTGPYVDHPQSYGLVDQVTFRPSQPLNVGMVVSVTVCIKGATPRGLDLDVVEIRDGPDVYFVRV